MVRHGQIYSPVEHALIAGCGGNWRNFTLVMFNAYIDDSGTSPSQRIAVASALVIPAGRILALESEWKTFCAKYQIQSFHASECVYRNPKSEFATWDDAKVEAAVARVRQVTKKYAVRAISFAVTKAEFDAEMPEKWKEFFCQDHYVWSIWHLLKLIRSWSEERQPPKMEFVFDHQEGKRRTAIEKALKHMEGFYPGTYAGHYSFRKRNEWAGLQCVDLLAWARLAAARFRFEGTPMHQTAKATNREYRNFGDDKWLSALWINKRDLREWLRKAPVPVVP